MTNLRVSPEAEEELAEAAIWYEARRTGLGIELIATVDAAFEAIVATPFGYPLWRSDRTYRKKVLERFPYVVFYRCEGDTVIIMAVAHRRRRPGYWAQR